MTGAALEGDRELRPAWRLLLERERWVTSAGLLLVAAGAWAYLLLASAMPGMAGMDAGMVMAPVPWTAPYAGAIFLMWWIMMAAMMLPSAAPAILLYDLVSRRTGGGVGGAATAAFAAGYLLVWGAFSLAAAFLHWALDQSGLLTMAMASASPVLGGAMLIAAGAWQLTPVKRACLARCQSPIQFLSHRWRKGRPGALRMGAEHGVYCLGCCWVMMGLLFYGGVMSFAWIGGLALYVLVEKSVPAGHWLTSLSGWGLIAAGGIVLVAALS